MGVVAAALEKDEWVEGWKGAHELNIHMYIRKGGGKGIDGR